MNSKEFKSLFDEVAKANNFEKAFGAWFKESTECILVLDLQKSNFGNYYHLNIKIYIQGIFNNHYSKSKELIKYTGDIFRRSPPEYREIFNCDALIDEADKKQQLHHFFWEFITPFSNKALSKKGVMELSQEGQILLLPAVREALNKLC